MIVLVGGQKGGTGKSTLSTNLAVWLAHAGADVLLIDTDSQTTSTHWAERREEAIQEGEGLPRIGVVQRTGANIGASIKDLASRYSQVVIDAGGRDSYELRGALSVCDRLIAPLRPSQADLETVAAMDELLSLTRSLRPDGGPLAHAVISMAPTHYRITEAQEAAQYLNEYTGLKLISPAICDRKAYRDALISGRGVIELGNEQAREEIGKVAEAIYS